MAEPPAVVPVRSLRWLVAAVLALAALGTLFAVIAAADATLSIWERLQRLPAALSWLVGALFALILGLTGWLLWRLLARPVVRRTPPPPVSRATVQARLEAAAAIPLPAAAQQQSDAQLAPLQAELQELDRRQSSGETFIAVFGDISTGKSSLLNALDGAEQRPTDVRGGTTTSVDLRQVELAGIGPVTCADVPGVHEWQGEARAVAAREEALRAHLVLYVCDGDLTRTQREELDWLKGFGKPLLLVLNKSDRYSTGELQRLRDRLCEQAGVPVVLASAGGMRSVLVEQADGSRQEQQRRRPAQLDALLAAIATALDRPRSELEQRRESAVLRAVDARLGAVEAEQRRLQARQLVQTYARRAVLGGMAAVAPGTDLLIQGVLGTQLVRELCALYGRKLSEVDADRLVQLAGGRLRGSSALVLAIAGNAAKAFPGLGTLGGGLLHAVAYGMIFASLGRALAESLEAGELRRDDVLARFERSLSDRAAMGKLAPQLLKLALEARQGEVAAAGSERGEAR